MRDDQTLREQALVLAAQCIGLDVSAEFFIDQAKKIEEFLDHDSANPQARHMSEA